MGRVTHLQLFANGNRKVYAYFRQKAEGERVQADFQGRRTNNTRRGQKGQEGIMLTAPRELMNLTSSGNKMERNLSGEVPRQMTGGRGKTEKTRLERELIFFSTCVRTTGAPGDSRINQSGHLGGIFSGIGDSGWVKLTSIG